METSCIRNHKTGEGFPGKSRNRNGKNICITSNCLPYSLKPNKPSICFNERNNNTSPKKPLSRTSLPPLRKGKLTFDGAQTNEQQEIVTCPTEYYRRLQSNRSNFSQIEENVPLKTTRKLDPLKRSTEFDAPVDEEESKDDSGNPVEYVKCASIKAKTVNENPAETASQSGQKTQNNADINEESMSVFASKNLLSGPEMERIALESYRASSKVRNEDYDDYVQKDRYLSAMEELFKQHKELYTRSFRGHQGLATNNVMLVPGRRIQPLNVIPEDPLMKFTGRHKLHSIGFKVPERSDSLIVEPDHNMLPQVRALHECEQRLMKAKPNIGQTLKTKESARSLTHILRERSLSFHISSSHFSDTADFDDPLGDLESLSSGTTTPLGEDESKWIDENRVYFHFNPVLQIYANQTPWRCRAKLRNKAINSDEESSSETPTGEFDFLLGTGTTKKGKRHQTGTILERAHSVDHSLELEYAINTLLKNRSSISSSCLSRVLSSGSLDSLSGEEHTGMRKAHSAAELTGPFEQPSDSTTAPNLVTTPTAGAPVNLLTTASSGQEHQVKQHGALFINPEPTEDILSPSFRKGKSPPRKVKEQIEHLRSMTSVQCLDYVLASSDPNPMAWFDLLDERLEHQKHRSTIREKLFAQFRLKGLSRRFMQIPNGMLGLQHELERGWEFRPKAELLMKCVVKHHVFKMPFSIPNADLIERIYMNSIVRHPGLYKLLLRRREILPQELQHFINRIMEMTETSDRMMATITNSTTKLAAVATAAKEMDASGFMSGGPSVNMPYPKTPVGIEHEETTVNESKTDNFGSTDFATQSKKETSYLTLYSNETDFDKGFYTQLRNPSTNILEEVALYLPEFAWHIRPLFEYIWVTLEDDLFDKLLSTHVLEHGDENIIGEFLGTQSFNINDIPRVNLDQLQMDDDPSLIPSKQNMLEWPETEEFCLKMFRNVLNYFTTHSVASPGDRTLHDLLTCLHMTNYYGKLSAIIVGELDLWIPQLLNGLESTYSSVREQTCCVLAYLVCNYRLLTKLHATSKNLLVANLTLSVLSAIGVYPETYSFYHGLLGYMLHSIPCLSILDCILLWLPTVENNPKSLVARDWPLFVYYVLKHWPRAPLFLDAMYQKKLLKPLENSYLQKHSKRSARLALSYLVRTCNVKSALLTCWPEGEDLN